MTSSLVALTCLIFIHLFANRARILGWVWHGRFLSFAAGISFAYVFVDLLPRLQEGQIVLKKAFDPVVPYLDKHAYLIALIGVLFFYGMHGPSQQSDKKNFTLSTIGYILFNFFVGATLADPTDPKLEPLWLYTAALGMHYFIRDHHATLENDVLFEAKVKWVLVFALVLGYLTGYFMDIPEALSAIVISFIAGGVLLNAFRYELPKRDQVGYVAFTLGSVFYTIIILKPFLKSF